MIDSHGPHTSRPKRSTRYRNKVVKARQ